MAVDEGMPLVAFSGMTGTAGGPALGVGWSSGWAEDGCLVTCFSTDFVFFAETAGTVSSATRPSRVEGAAGARSGWLTSLWRGCVGACVGSADGDNGTDGPPRMRARLQ